MAYESVIGLEVHAQLLTKTKLFCSCSTTFDAYVNENICQVCTGMPGVLPVLNKDALTFATKMALATHCKINNRSQFARKNYFYPDLPKGYQISQFELPFAEHGYVFVRVGGEEKKIGITRIHMEEDAGKSVHHSRASALNFNRAGIPLIEIVSEPDLRTPAEAAAYMRALRDILLYLEICDCNMEEGSIRCDANVSIRKVGETKFGTKSEVKNLNSFKFLERALAYEIERQKDLIEGGGVVSQETLLWDSSKQKTFTMRTKESAHDYRYFPDPDLLPAVIDEAWIEKTKTKLPELPEQKRERFVKEYGLTPYDAGVLTSSRELAQYYETATKSTKSPKLVSNWLSSELLGKLNEAGLEITDSPVSAQNLGKLVSLIDEGEISGKIAKSVFEEMFESKKDPNSVIEEKELKQISDPAEIERVVDQIIIENKTQVEQYRSGKIKMFGFFVGQVMKATEGKANPELVNKVLKDKLHG